MPRYLEQLHATRSRMSRVYNATVHKEITILLQDPLLFSPVLKMLFLCYDPIVAMFTKGTTTTITATVAIIAPTISCAIGDAAIFVRRNRLCRRHRRSIFAADVVINEAMDETVNVFHPAVVVGSFRRTAMRASARTLRCTPPMLGGRRVRTHR